MGPAPGGATASPPAVETATIATGMEATSTGTTSTTTVEAPSGSTSPTVTHPGAANTTSTATTQTPGIPVTGSNILLLECQFCIQNIAQALLVIPDTSTFQVLTPSASVTTTGDANTGCNTVDTFQGKQIVLCRGPENTSMKVNVCANGADCKQLNVNLQSCQLSQAGTPIATGTETPGTTGGVGGVATSTPGANPTDTPPAATATA